ncbi:sulfotransferase [Sphingomonas sabuli]|uniref:Sulfotransferase n=1 Tax=Sphingomonas sabuli TaxID=2764186 RepID=A0A7G9KZK1_9SPHN|nr:sulfotransferase [Sphingomonas sabuli]QNM81800.1 sulfotransferase [Sphingomonas sabuli]
MTTARPHPLYAFVLGVARSGTTAMVQLLNTHSAICMGVERYKRLYPKLQAFPPELLEKERFFEFRPEDTNLGPGTGIWDKNCAPLEEKWDSASIFGDKEMAGALPFVARDIPDARIVFMLRDIGPVASSWNVRAAKETDSWAEENDYRVAVDHWNEANRLALDYADTLGERMLLIDYETFFSGAEGYVDVLLGFLGLRHERRFDRTYGARVARYCDIISQKPSLVLEGQEEYLAQKADRAAYERLLGMARDQRQALVSA